MPRLSGTKPLSALRFIVTLRIGHMAGSLSLRLGKNQICAANRHFFLASFQASLCVYPPRFLSHSMRL